MQVQYEVTIEVTTKGSSVDPVEMSNHISSKLYEFITSLEERDRFASIEEIKNICLEHFPNVSSDDLYTTSRDQIYVLPRQVVMVMLKKHTKLSLKFIGQHFGKDHSTVIHALNSVSDRYDTEKKFKTMYELIEYKIKQFLNEPNESMSRYRLSNQRIVQKISGESKPINE